MSGNSGYPRHVKHGLRKLPEYRIWQAIKDRVFNPLCKDYPNYGGRGIRVCERWTCKTEGVVNFYTDMGPRPSPEHSIDRINNDGDYCPENCRWTTRKSQNRNQRSNHLLTYNGKTQCIAAWAEEIGIAFGALSLRIAKGWTTERALTTPPRKTKVLR